MDVNVRLFCNMIRDHEDRLNILLVFSCILLDYRIMNVKSCVDR